MKRSRIIWTLVVGAIVYWGAAYPTLGNWIEALSIKLQPLGKVIDENRILFGLSCLALILAVIYRFALQKSAEYRNATGELNDLLTNAVFCVVLTVFSHRHMAGNIFM